MRLPRIEWPECPPAAPSLSIFAALFASPTGVHALDEAPIMSSLRTGMATPTSRQVKDPALKDFN
jgi:hypothetical protein